MGCCWSQGGSRLAGGPERKVQENEDAEPRGSGNERIVYFIDTSLLTGKKLSGLQTYLTKVLHPD